MYNGFDEIQTKLTDYLEERGIDTGRKFACIHPDHDEKTPSAHVFKGRYVKCFGCSRTMTIFDAASAFEGLPEKGHPEFFRGNVLVLAKRYHIPLPAWSDSPTLKIHQEVISFISSVYMKKLMDERDQTIDELLESYLESEKLTDIVKKYKTILLSPGYMDIYHHLKKAGFSDLDIGVAGYTREIIPDREHLLYPLWITKDISVGVSVRNPYDIPKYKNTNNNDAFSKSSYLYGMFLGPKPEKPLYLVEGQKDVLAMWINKLQAVAPLGSALTKEHLAILQRGRYSEIILCFDGDKAGRDATIKYAKQIFSFGINLQIMELKPDDDPFSLLIEDEGWLPEPVSAISYLYDYYIQSGSLEMCVSAIVDLITTVRSYILQETLGAQLAEISGISASAISKEIESRIEQKKDDTQEKVMNVLESAMEKAKSHPEMAIKLTQEAIEYAETIAEKNSSFDNDFIIEVISSIQDGTISSNEDDVHFRRQGLGVLTDILHRGGTGWIEGTLFAIGGDPHAGKTALTLQAMSEFLLGDPNTMVIHFSTDDGCQLLLPRLISSLVFSPDFKIGMVLDKDLAGPMLLRKERAMKTIVDWAGSERLIMKDQSFGKTLAKASDLVKYYRDKYPLRKILFVNDNFHKNSDYMEFQSNSRQEMLANDIKALAVKEKLTAWATMEYRKTKASKNGAARTSSLGDIKGDGSIHYNLSVGINLQNDHVESNGDLDKAVHVHRHSGVLMPRVLMNIAKNKVAGTMGTYYMDLFPESSFFSLADQGMARYEAEARREQLYPEKERKW